MAGFRSHSFRGEIRKQGSKNQGANALSSARLSQENKNYFELKKAYQNTRDYMDYKKTSLA